MTEAKYNMADKKEISKILRDMKDLDRLDSHSWEVIKRTFLPQIRRGLSGINQTTNIVTSSPELDPEHRLNDKFLEFKEASVQEGCEYAYFKTMLDNMANGVVRMRYRGGFLKYLHDRLCDKNNEFTCIQKNMGSMVEDWWRGLGGDWETRKDIPKYRRKLRELEPGYFDEVTMDIHKILGRKKSGGLRVQYYSKYLLELKYFKYMQLRTLAKMEKFGAKKPYNKKAPDTQPERKMPPDSKGDIMDLYESEPSINEFELDKEVIKDNFSSIYSEPSHRLVFYLKWLRIGYKHIEDILKVLANTPKWRDMGVKPLGSSAAQNIITGNKAKLPNDKRYIDCLINFVLEEEFGAIETEPVVAQYLEKK